MPGDAAGGVAAPGSTAPRTGEPGWVSVSGRPKAKYARSCQTMKYAHAARAGGGEAVPPARPASTATRRAIRLMLRWRAGSTDAGRGWSQRRSAQRRRRRMRATAPRRHPISRANWRRARPRPWTPGRSARPRRCDGRRSSFRPRRAPCRNGRRPGRTGPHRRTEAVSRQALEARMPVGEDLRAAAGQVMETDGAVLHRHVKQSEPDMSPAGDPDRPAEGAAARLIPDPLSGIAGVKIGRLDEVAGADERLAFGDDRDGGRNAGNRPRGDRRRVLVGPDRVIAPRLHGTGELPPIGLDRPAAEPPVRPVVPHDDGRAPCVCRGRRHRAAGQAGEHASEERDPPPHVLLTPRRGADFNRCGGARRAPPVPPLPAARGRIRDRRGSRRRARRRSRTAP